VSCFADAVRSWQHGDHLQAQAHCRTVLQEDPAHADAHRLLGEILTAHGPASEAIAACRRVEELAPDDAANLRRLAQLLGQAGELAPAVATLERALQVEPNNARAWNNLGNFLTGLGRPAEAIPALERALALQGNYAIALNNLGNALRRVGRVDEAVVHYERALALPADCPEARANLASLLVARGVELLAGQVPLALAAFDRAIELQPLAADGHRGRGRALVRLGRATEALDSFSRAAELDPRDTEAHVEAGHLLLQLGRAADAHAAYGAALVRQPQSAAALVGVAMSLIWLTRFEEVRPLLAQLRDRGVRHPYLPGYELFAQLHCCDWSGLESASQSIVDGLRRGQHTDLPLSLMAHNDSPADQRRCAEIYTALMCSAPAPRARPVRRGPLQRRPRIGYLSTDFREHPVAQLIAGVFETHDRSRFETFAFSAGPDDRSKLRSRLQRGIEHFEEVAALPDEAIAARMAEAQIDIAVDLGGHTSGSRTRVLAFRPAPLQVTWLGYPGTLGSDYIDYIIADRHVIPEDDRVHYAEQVIYLPDAYLPSEPAWTALQSPSRAAAGLPAVGFVYCCFNTPYKIHPTVFAAWMRILKAVPSSVLWLRETWPSATRNLRREAERLGVDAARLIFAPLTAALADHHARLALADLFLDTLPYNAHASALDALRAGVPVLTSPGTTFCSRVAGSLLHACGLGELSVATLEEYEQRAIALGSDPTRLAACKARLAGVRSSAPLFDLERFTRHLETALSEIWERQVRGDRPTPLYVQRRPLAGAELA
jgi:predicted O-linked N-acetylglucosamine transferase (SPINDLY family)